jgi:hypothetical protein
MLLVPLQAGLLKNEGQRDSVYEMEAKQRALVE